MVIFGIILRNIRSKYRPKRTKLHHFSKFSRRNLPQTPLPGTAFNVATCIHIWKNYLHASVKSCNVCAFIAFWKKMTIKKIHFSQFIKITLHWLYQLFCTDPTWRLASSVRSFTVFLRFPKKVNFTRSCAFVQKV